MFTLDMVSNSTVADGLSSLDIEELDIEASNAVTVMYFITLVRLCGIYPLGIIGGILT